jgi:hypothetical protein
MCKIMSVTLSKVHVSLVEKKKEKNVLSGFQGAQQFCQLLKNRMFISMLYHHIFYRLLDCWNLLPLKLKQSTSLNIFKCNIRSVDLNKYVKGNAFNLTLFWCYLYSISLLCIFKGLPLVILTCIVRIPIVCTV